MKRLLLIAYAFPPLANAEAYVCAKTMAHLPGWDTTVLTLHPQANGLAEDHSLDAYVANGFAEVIRIGPPAWLRPLPPRLARWFLFRFCVVTRLPDFVYLNAALKARLAALPLGEYAAMVTRSQWPSAHMIGRQIKERWPHLRWLAHFSDPWVDNPYLYYYPPTSWLNRRWERQTMAAADAVCFVSEETLDLVMAKYPPEWRRKAFCLPHAFDPVLYDAETPQPADRYVIRSLGKFYGLRTPEPCYAAVARLCRHEPQLLHNAAFEFIGDLTRFGDTLARYPDAKPFVSILPRVAYRESLRLMQSAHCLLVIDAPLRHSIFFPSKLVDYIGSGRFIAAITPPGATQRIVDEVGGWTADPGDRKGVYNLLRRLLHERPQRLTAAPRFDAVNVRRLLADHLQLLCAGDDMS